MRAASGLASGARHIGGVGLQALLIVGIVIAVALAFSPIFKPASDLAGTQSVQARGGANITVPDGVFAGTTTATLNPGGSDAWAYARCYQDGTLVYAQYVRSTSSGTATFTLGPTPMWDSGAANCTAEEGSWGKNGRWRAVATTTFNVSG